MEVFKVLQAHRGESQVQYCKVCHWQRRSLPVGVLIPTGKSARPDWDGHFDDHFARKLQSVLLTDLLSEQVTTF